MTDETEETRDLGGRPTKYDPAFCQEAATLCAGGATDEEIADALGVSARTLYRWQAKHPDFCHALKAAKAPADERVERSLFHRASGFAWTEQQAIKLKEVLWENGNKVERERVEVVDVLRQMPPDTTAAIFWLKNRRADQWRDKQEVEHNATGELASFMQRIAEHGRRVHDPVQS